VLVQATGASKMMGVTFEEFFCSERLCLLGEALFVVSIHFIQKLENVGEPWLGSLCILAT